MSASLTTQEPVDVAQDCAQAKHAALRMLAGREHSVRELQRKLMAKGANPAAVANVLEELQEANLLSDARFAESYVNARTTKGFGPMHIRQGLLERGVGEDLVDDYLTHSGDHWCERARAALAKRFGSEPVADRNEWNRQARFLAGRGYPADIIYRVLGSNSSMG